MLGSVADAEVVVQEAFLRQPRGRSRGGSAEGVPRDDHDEPLVGALPVAKALIGWRQMAIEGRPTEQRRSRASPGIGYHWADGSVAGVQELEIADGVVVAIRSILNPDKLAHLSMR